MSYTGYSGFGSLSFPAGSYSAPGFGSIGSGPPNALGNSGPAGFGSAYQGWSAYPRFGGNATGVLADVLNDDTLNRWGEINNRQFLSRWGTGGKNNTTTGTIATDLGGVWAKLDAYDPMIQQAVQRVQQDTGVLVDPNRIKAHMAVESGYGAQTDAVQTDNEGLVYALVGMKPATAQSWGIDPSTLAGNPSQQIYALAKTLAEGYKLYGQQYGWQGVSLWYFSGNPVVTGYQDSLSNRDQDYTDSIESKVKLLNQGLGTGGAPGTGTELSVIWGGAPSAITQEFGPTDFSNGNPIYNYGAAYGVTGHPALDVGIATGTRLYLPVGGVVVNAGGTGYYTDDSIGNAPGSGEFRIRMANGDELILGHMSGITVQPGQQLQPGDFVGYSGTANGAHVHVEYRKYLGPPGTGTSSGYQILDPRQALGGTYMGTIGAAPASGISKYFSGWSGWTGGSNTTLGGVNNGVFGHQWWTALPGMGGRAA